MKPIQFGHHHLLSTVDSVPLHLQLTADDHGQPRKLDSIRESFSLPVSRTELHESFQMEMTVTRFSAPEHPYGMCDEEVFLSLRTRTGERHYQVQDSAIAQLATCESVRTQPSMADLLVHTVRAFESGARMGYEFHRETMESAVAEGRLRIKVKQGVPSLEIAPQMELLKPWISSTTDFVPDADPQVVTLHAAGVEVGRHIGGHPIVKTTLTPEQNRFRTAEEALQVAKAMIPTIYAREYPWAAAKPSVASPAQSERMS